ncbi:MAG: acetyl-CoA carboxylase biotin carboxyl carrier protein [Gammaproteobacteria bacterium]|nr:acetyl-CoA carboxylase biotin carboxyl carrier protein [Gammaproteobacteria bacterium]
MNIPDLKKLIDLMENSTLTEIEIGEGKDKIKLSRQSSAVAHPHQQTHYLQMAAPAAQTVAAPASAPLVAEPAQPEGHVVKAPMVGTAYLAASPDVPPFVKVGQSVKVGDPLCIIEAMKMMNRIEADKAGVITSILAEAGKPVEFDQPLFIIA